MHQHQKNSNADAIVQELTGGKNYIDADVKAFFGLDGSDVAEWLTEKGCEVKDHEDRGGYGVAYIDLADGQRVAVSTNGFVYIV